MCFTELAALLLFPGFAKIEPTIYAFPIDGYAAIATSASSTFLSIIAAHAFSMYRFNSKFPLIGSFGNTSLHSFIVRFIVAKTTYAILSEDSFDTTPKVAIKIS